MLKSMEGSFCFNVSFFPGGDIVNLTNVISGDKAIDPAGGCVCNQ